MMTAWAERNSPNSFRFWGSLMVLLCFLIGIVVYGGSRYSFGVFMKPMAESMGWTRTQVSLAVTIHLISYALLSPIIGRLYDTIGMRKVMITGSVLLSAALCGMIFVDSLWLFYLLYGVVAAFGSNAAGRLASATIVANWFVRQRGLMMGITAVAVGVGTAIMAPVTRQLLDAFGWRMAFVAIGLLTAVLVLLPITLIVKGHGRPEDRGFGADGAALATANLSEQDLVEQVAKSDNWTTSEALRTKAFYAIAIVTGLIFIADYMVLLHSTADFEDRGLTGSTAVSLLSLITLSSVIGRIGFGLLADRINMKAGFGLFLGLQLIAMPLIIVGGTDTNLLYLFAVLFGLGYAGAAVFVPFIVADYFGTTNFGSIFGLVTMGAALSGAVGGVLGGWIFDTHNNYQLAWYFCAIAQGLAIVIIYTAGGRPRRKSA